MDGPRLAPPVGTSRAWGTPSSSRTATTRRTASNSSGSCALIVDRPVISLGGEVRPEPKIGQAAPKLLGGIQGMPCPKAGESQRSASQVDRGDHPALSRRRSAPPQIDQHALGFRGGIFSETSHEATVRLLGWGGQSLTLPRNARDRRRPRGRRGHRQEIRRKSVDARDLTGIACACWVSGGLMRRCRTER